MRPLKLDLTSDELREIAALVDTNKGKRPIRIGRDLLAKMLTDHSRLLARYSEE